MREEQQKCRVTAALHLWKEQGILLTDNALKQVAMSEGERLVIVDGLLFHVSKPRTDAKNAHTMQVVVPTALRNIALSAAHDSLVGGAHLEFKKTYEKVIERW